MIPGVQLKNDADHISETTRQRGPRKISLSKSDQDKLLEIDFKFLSSAQDGAIRTANYEDVFFLLI